jgi:lipopolysaccharide export system protein LptC
MRPKRIARALAGFGAVALAVLVGVTVYVVHHRSEDAISTVVGLVPGSLLHAHNFHWTQMKAGERQWVLTALDATYAADKTSLVLNQPRLSMISSEGKNVVVQAPHAVLTLDGGEVKRAKLTGGTRMLYGDFVLTTDSVVFMPDQDQVQASGLVTIEGNGLKVTGIGLAGHPKKREFRLLSQVSTTIVPKPNSDRSKQS